MNTQKPYINVCLLQPPGYIHALALLEAAQYIAAKAREVGYPAGVSKNRVYASGLNIVFGAHINPKDRSALSNNVVIFNTEQLPEKSAWTNADYMRVLHDHYVWDYSPVNLANIKHNRKQLVSFHHAPALNRIRTAKEPEYDLIFYGSMNDRRKKILENLSIGRNLKILNIFGLYGPERDELLINARALLNLHFYDSQIFQQIRAFYALSNGIPMISENFPRHSAPAIYGETVFTPESEPFEKYVARLLLDRDAFTAEAARKIEVFRASLDTDEFNNALEKTIRTMLGETTVTTIRPRALTRINIGAGKNYKAGYLNLGSDPDSNPDIVLDLSAPLKLPFTAHSAAYGETTFTTSSIDEIIAVEALENTLNLRQLMTNCMSILKESGVFEIQVPYDLALSAWQDPKHVRAFNENSWLYYTERFWHMGWFDYRFDCVSIDLIPSEFGKNLIAKNVAQAELLRTPRAIDSMKVILKKRKTTSAEKTTARAFSNSIEF